MAIFKGGESACCPHCRVTVRMEFHPSFTPQIVLKGPSQIVITLARCPQCLNPVVCLEEAAREGGSVDLEKMLWPTAINRAPVPTEVPKHIAADYREASMVLPLSPKASAALSRRCLQTVLREAGRTTKKDLADQIEEVEPKLPSHVGGSLHAVRNVGNFAAHPQKSKASGEILDVEPGEAEWNLEVLDALFDFYYVRPAVERSKIAALNAKLKLAGKPEITAP